MDLFRLWILLLLLSGGSANAQVIGTCDFNHPGTGGQFCGNTGAASGWFSYTGDIHNFAGPQCSPSDSSKCGFLTVQGFQNRPLAGTIANNQTWCFISAHNDYEPCSGGGGGAGNPGGTNGAIQYNNGGVFGGAVLTGLQKDNGTSAPTAAVAGTDYQAAIAGNTLTAGTFANQIGSNGALSGRAVADADLSFTDITTGNVSTTKHGFVPKASNIGGQFLDSTGNWSVPAGGGGGGTPGGTAGAMQYNNAGGFGGLNGTGLPKLNGASNPTIAAAGTDYAPATSGSAILKGNGSGGFSNAVSNTDYQAPLTFPLAANLGGSGITSPTAHDLMIAEGASAFTLINLGADQLLLGGPSDPAPVALLNCGDATHALAYSTSTHTFSCQAITATATPGGTNGAVQYNNAGVMAGVVLTGLQKDNGTSAPTAAVSGTDYAPATSGTSILKGNGSGAFASAVSGTDYAPATSGSSLLKGNGAGGFSNAVSSTDYAPATSGSAILKGNGTGGFSNATAGTDYAAATSGSANTPLFNNGTGGFTNGTRSGNTTTVATTTGSLPTGDLAQFDASGNIVDSTHTFPTGLTPGGSSNAVQYNNAGAFAGTGPSATVGQKLTQTTANAAPAWASNPDWFTVMFLGAVNNSAILSLPIGVTANFPANFTSATYPDGNSFQSCQTNPGSTDVYTVKCSGTTIGTITLQTNCATAPTNTGWASTSGAVQTCTAGSLFEIDAPATTQGEANVSLTFRYHNP